MTKPTVKPCEHCGSTRTQTTEGESSLHMFRVPGYAQMHCRHCDSWGPAVHEDIGSHRMQAIEDMALYLWNKRHGKRAQLNCLYCKATRNARTTLSVEASAAKAGWRTDTIGGVLYGCCDKCADTHDAPEFLAEITRRSKV